MRTAHAATNYANAMCVIAHQPSMMLVSETAHIGQWAKSPSIENTPSVTIRHFFIIWAMAVRFVGKSCISLCLKRTNLAPESCPPALMQAWASSSFSSNLCPDKSDESQYLPNSQTPKIRQSLVCLMSAKSVSLQRIIVVACNQARCLAR